MSTPSGNPAAPAEVVRMFDRIAPLYDAMNTLMTVGLYRRWRRAALAAARLEPAMRVLDLACGTGKLARAAAARLAPDGEVIGLDVSTGMLDRARRARPAHAAVPVRWVAGDALAAPFEDGRFDAVIIGFGLRNLADFSQGLREMARLAAPRGRVVVLEIAVPRGRVARLLFATWFRRVVPGLGRLLGRGAAYAYLPASLASYPSPERVAALMADAGLENVRWRWLASGMATLHVGRRPGGRLGR